MHKFVAIFSTCALTALLVTGIPESHFWLWLSAVSACTFSIGSFLSIEFLKRVRVKIGGRYINTVEEVKE